MRPDLKICNRFTESFKRFFNNFLSKKDDDNDDIFNHPFAIL